MSKFRRFGPIALVALLLAPVADAKPTSTSTRRGVARPGDVVELTPQRRTRPSRTKAAGRLLELQQAAKFDGAALQPIGWSREDPFLSTAGTLKDEADTGSLWIMFNDAELVMPGGAVFPKPSQRSSSMQLVFETKDKGDFVVSCSAQAWFDDGPFELTIAADHKPDRVIQPKQMTFDLLVHAWKAGVFQWEIEGNRRWMTTSCTASRIHEMRAR